MSTSLKLKNLFSDRGPTITFKVEGVEISVCWTEHGKTECLKYELGSSGAFALTMIAEAVIDATNADWQDAWPVAYKDSVCLQAGLRDFVWTIRNCKLPDSLHINVSMENDRVLTGYALKDDLREFATELLSAASLESQQPDGHDRVKVVVCSIEVLLFGYKFTPREGVVFEQFDGGDELLERLLTEPWDLAIVAAMMPMKDGYEVCCKCESKGRPVVLAIPGPVTPTWSAVEAGLPDVVVVELPRQSDVVNTMIAIL